MRLTGQTAAVAGRWSGVAVEEHMRGHSSERQSVVAAKPGVQQEVGAASWS